MSQDSVVFRFCGQNVGEGEVTSTNSKTSHGDSVLEAVAFAAEQFLHTDNWHHCMDRVLQRLGAATNVSRVYVVEHHQSGSRDSQTCRLFEWEGSGWSNHPDNVPTREIAYQNLGQQLWSLDIISKPEVVAAHVKDLPEKDRQLFLKRSVRSILVVPVLVEEVLSGFIGFDQCGSQREWSAGEVDALRAFASILAAALRRQELRRELRENEQRFRTVADFTYDWEYWVGNDGEFRYVSPSCERITGYSRDEFLANSQLLNKIVHPEDRDVLTTHAEVCSSADEADTLDFRIIARDGREVWIEHCCQPVYNSEGVHVGRRVSNRDITDVKRTIMEKEALDERLLQSQHLESLGLLAGGVAHDFNNLLTGIIGNASFALENLLLDDPVKKNLEQIMSISDRASSLTQQMLAYSGRGKLMVESVDLSCIVRETSELLSSVISKKVKVKLELDQALPAVQADATQLGQVLMNLITNASQAMENDIGVITIRTTTFHADRSYLDTCHLGDKLPEAEYVSIEVVDTGSGMDSKTVACIFDPFFTTKFTGRGLGLAAVLGIVKGHGGAMKVDSEPGVGTIFRVLFPKTSIKNRVTDSSSRTDGACSTGGSILVVDDEDIVRDVAKRALERADFKVYTAANGWDAVELFRVLSDEIVLVLLDLTMPQMGGEEALEQLQLIKRSIRVLICSGYSEHEVSERFSGCEHVRILHKPFHTAALVSEVNRLLAGTSEAKILLKKEVC